MEKWSSRKKKTNKLRAKLRRKSSFGQYKASNFQRNPGNISEKGTYLSLKEFLKLSHLYESRSKIQSVEEEKMCV